MDLPSTEIRKAMAEQALGKGDIRSSILEVMNPTRL
jgi:hypothetical protein